MIGHGLRILRYDGTATVPLLCASRLHGFDLLRWVRALCGIFHQIIKKRRTGAHTVIHCRMKRGAPHGDNHGGDATHRDKALKLVDVDDLREIQREVRPCVCVNVRVWVMQMCRISSELMMCLTLAQCTR